MVVLNGDVTLTETEFQLLPVVLNVTKITKTCLSMFTCQLFVEHTFVVQCVQSAVAVLDATRLQSMLVSTEY